MTETRWKRAGQILILLAGLVGILAVAKQLPAMVQDYAALAAALLAFGARWCEQQLPAVKPKGGGVGPAVFVLIAVGLMASAGCKAPPLATGYRSHALLLIARDGAGKTLAKVQRARMLRCEAEHKPGQPAFKVLLLDCYKRVRAPVTVWTKRIRPAITAGAAALWFALEVTHAAGDKRLDKLGKAAVMACAGLTAAEATLKQYMDKLGLLAPVVLGALAGGRILVCP